MPGKKAAKKPVSKAQNRLMQAVAHSPATARSTGIPRAVAKEYTAGAHGKKLGKLPERKAVARR